MIAKKIRPRHKIRWFASGLFLLLLILARFLVPTASNLLPLPKVSAKSLPEAEPINAKTLLANPNVNPDYHPPAPFYGNPPPPGVVRPAEFEQMDGILLAMYKIDPAFEEMWLDMIMEFSQHGFVWILADSDMEKTMGEMLEEEGISEEDFAFLDYPFDSIWIRDYGPEFVILPDGSRHIIDNFFLEAISFWPRDDAVPIEIGKDNWINEDGSPMPVHSHMAPMAGGNLMTDGAGTCFTTKSMYTHDMPEGWDKKRTDSLLFEYYGCKQVIALNPICQESTGHIDLFAKIVSPTTILLGEFDEETLFDGETYSKWKGNCQTHYPNDRKSMELNLEILSSTTNLEGEPWEIIRVPMPEPYFEDNSWIYRSYVNAQLLNDLVVMPTYRKVQPDETIDDLEQMEKQAIKVFKEAMPEAKIHPIPVDHLIPYGGAIHCITHEIPAEFPGEEEADNLEDEDVFEEEPEENEEEEKEPDLEKQDDLNDDESEEEEEEVFQDE